MTEKKKSTKKGHWALQVEITCPHCNHSYDWMNSKDYCEYDGWEKMPGNGGVLGPFELETFCDECKLEFIIEIPPGL